MRGGCPRPSRLEWRYAGSSPHARGLSPYPGSVPILTEVFPACAGVVPNTPPAQASAHSLPRMCGGCPFSITSCAIWPRSSPHARGLSALIFNFRPNAAVFPACAGVVPRLCGVDLSRQCLPRMRGGCPVPSAVPDRPVESSPHARGLSVLRRIKDRCRTGLPRMRGGCPYEKWVEDDRITSSPHARGLSGEEPVERVPRLVFPACAGVVPCPGPCCPTSVRLPRMRGGCPSGTAVTNINVASSPHARGLSRTGHPAGVVLHRPSCIRGGCPMSMMVCRLSNSSVPHRRGSLPQSAA